MGGHAWVTLATNDSYSLGALVLAHSLKQAGTVHRLAVLVTPGVTNSMRQKLAGVFDLVEEVNVLDSKDEANLRLLKRPELGITFTKLHCWRLTQFEKCVFLDADTLVLKNADELFDREEFSAAPDVGWPDCFNSGVFVYRPSNETYDKLIQFALAKGSFDGGDQGLLNLYFNDWAHKDISRHLPFAYNMCSTACYSYLPAFKQFGTDVKIVHFIGATKPWLQYFNTESKQVQPGGDMQHLKTVLQAWWEIFCNLVHSNLTSEMSVPPTIALTLTASDHRDVWDPWEDYAPADDARFESHNTNALPMPEPSVHIQITTLPEPEIDPIQSPLIEEVPRPSPCPIPEPPQVRNVLSPEGHSNDPEPDPNESSSSHNSNSNSNTSPYELVNITDAEGPEEPEVQTPDGGLAGAFAQFNLGAPRSQGQSELEETLRRQSWEVGNIDYMGRDAFDKIWSKITESIAKEGETVPATEEVKKEEVKAAEASVAPVQEEVKEAAPAEAKSAEVKPVEAAPIALSAAPESKPAEEIKPETVKVEEVKTEPAAVTEPPKVEEVKPAVPKVEPVPVEAPTVEAPKVEEAKPTTEEVKPSEAPKVVETPKVEEAPKTEEVKPEAPKVEETKLEAPKSEELKVDIPKVDEAKPEVPKTEEAKVDTPEAPKVEEAKQEAPKTDEVKLVTTKTDEAKPEALKAEEAKPEVPKTEPPVAPKVEDSKEAVKAEEVKPETPKEEAKVDAKVEEVPKAVLEEKPIEVKPETPAPVEVKPDVVATSDVSKPVEEAKPVEAAPVTAPAIPEVAPAGTDAKAELPVESKSCEKPQEAEAPKTETPVPVCPKTECTEKPTECPKAECPLKKEETCTKTLQECPKAESPQKKVEEQSAECPAKTECPKETCPAAECPKKDCSTGDCHKQDCPKVETPAPTAEAPKPETPADPAECVKPEVLKKEEPAAVAAESTPAPVTPAPTAEEPKAAPKLDTSATPLPETEVPATPEVTAPTPPTTPAADVPAEAAAAEALEAAAVVPETPPPTAEGASGVNAPVPPPRKSSGAKKQPKSKK